MKKGLFSYEALGDSMIKTICKLHLFSQIKVLLWDANIGSEIVEKPPSQVEVLLEFHQL